MRVLPVIALDLESLNTLVAWQHVAGAAEVCCFCAVDEFSVQHLMRLANNAGLADAFEISTSDVEIAHAAAAQRGWKIIAFVHTHPAHGPDMSFRDARCFDHDSLPWIIIGTPTSTPRQRAYTRY